MNPTLTELETLLLPLAQPAATMLWTQVVYPEIQKLEAKIGAAEVQTFAQNVAAAINSFVQAEVAKI
jgi:hypothetical protein